MKRKVFFLLFTAILSALVFSSCEEEEPADNNIPTVVPWNPDTLFSGDYFPTPPNSWWLYRETNGNTIMHKTDTSYRLRQVFYNGYFELGDTTHYYVSYYDGDPVTDYTIHNGVSTFMQSYTGETLLPEDIYVGCVYSMYVKYDTPPVGGRGGTIVSVDTSIVLDSVQYDSVIVVEIRAGPGQGPNYGIPYGRLYLAKHIGIIKKEWCDLSHLDSIVNEEILIDYQIGSP